jgi:hypothetical protein
MQELFNKLSMDTIYILEREKKIFFSKDPLPAFIDKEVIMYREFKALSGFHTNERAMATP